MIGSHISISNIDINIVINNYGNNNVTNISGINISCINISANSSNTNSVITISGNIDSTKSANTHTTGRCKHLLVGDDPTHLPTGGRWHTVPPCTGAYRGYVTPNKNILSENHVIC